MRRYEFCEENKEYLLRFLRSANNTKSNKYCNLTEHQLLTKYFPLDDKLQHELETTVENNIIDLTESNDEEVVDNNVSDSHISQFKLVMNNLNTNDIQSQIENHSSADDVIHLIKENLQMEKSLSSPTLKNLNELECSQNKIFSLLYEELSLEEVIYFGFSLKIFPVTDNLVLSLEYSDQLQELLNDFSMRFSEILLDELTPILLNKEFYSKVFLQFIDGLSADFKQKLLRKFTTTCEKLHESYIPVIEMLLCPHLEFDTLNKLIEVLLSSEADFTTDKAFGKLLMSVIKTSGRNVAMLEQPLKHIIGSHKSIWKSKLQKQLDDCLLDSSMLSQSIRY